MPHEPGHEECPPPHGGGFRPHPAFRKLPIQIGTTGCFRADYDTQGQPQSHSLDCAAIVTWVWPVREGEEYPRVNVTLFLNTNSGTSGLMQKREVPLWGMDRE